MWLIRCEVRFGTAWSGASGVRGRPGHHRRNRQQEPDRDRLRGETGRAGRGTGCAKESSTVHRTRGNGTEGVQSPGTDHHPTETNDGPANITVLTPGMRSLDVRTTAGNIEARAGENQENPEDARYRRRPTTRTGCYDTGRQTIGGRSPSVEDAVNECPILSGPGSLNSPPPIRRPRTEVSRLPGLLRNGSNSIQRLDCTTPDGHTTNARQLSRWTLEDAVRIQSSEGGRLRPDFATRPGGWGNRTGRLTSIYTTPGSSNWGPRPSSHHRTENAGD